DPPLVLDRDTHPDVRGPLQPWCDLGEVLVALGQDLEGVLACLSHHREHLLDKLERDLRMEEIAHRVHEDHARPPPAERLLESAWPELKVEALLVRVARNTTPALGKGLGVTVSAARRNLRAPGYRVPGGLGPLDCAAVCQVAILFGFVWACPTNVCS